MEKILHFIDLYSQPVVFTFRKKNNFKTIWGGCVSLFTISIILFLSYLLGMQIYNKDNPYIRTTIIKNSIPKNLTFIKDLNFNNINKNNNNSNEKEKEKDENLEEEKVEKEIFYNSIKIKRDKKLVTFEDFKFYLDLEFNQIKNINGKIYKYPLNFELCKKFLNFTEELKKENFDLLNTYCLNDNYNLSGNYLMEGSSYVEINIKKCNNSSLTSNFNSSLISKSPNIPYLSNEIINYECFPNDVIDKMLEKNELTVEWYFQETNFNLSSFNNYEIKEVAYYYFDLIPDLTKINIVSFSRNIYTLFDSILSDIISSDRKKFTSLHMKKNYNDIIDIDKENILLKIIFISSREFISYERKYDNLIGELASIGGVFDIIYGLGFIFVLIFAKENFNEAMIQEFYDLNDANYEDLTKQNFDDVIGYFYNFHRNNSFKNYYDYYKNDINDKSNNNFSNLNQVDNDNGFDKFILENDKKGK
jgi:hypothetical protein